MDWHVRFRAAALVLAAAALGGCARDVTSPRTAIAPRLAISGVAGSYVVVFKSTGLPADLGTRMQALGATVTYKHAPTGIAVVAGLDAVGASKLKAAKDVADVEPDFQFTLDQPVAAVETDAPVESPTSQTDPTTALRYYFQWNMRVIHADQAWAAGKLGDPGVTVAILDTGIDYAATDLVGLVDLARSNSFVASDTQYLSLFTGKQSFTDFNGHGTNVATQVSSKAYALAGVTSKTTLLAVKVLNAKGSGTFTSVLQGLLWAADKGADVASMSLGGGFYKSGMGQYVAAVNRAFDYAKQKGMLVVVAAGNDELNLDKDGNLFKTYCAAPHVLCVSATGPGTADGNVDAFALYSNYGRSEIGVAAPGGNYKVENGALVVSAWPWGNDIASWVWSYCSRTKLAWILPDSTPAVGSCAAGNRLTGMVGTSQATPHVSGLAALLVNELGHHRPNVIKQAIMKSADDLGQPGTDPFYGAGRINVARALGL